MKNEANENNDGSRQRDVCTRDDTATPHGTPRRASLERHADEECDKEEEENNAAFVPAVVPRARRSRGDVGGRPSALIEWMKEISSNEVTHADGTSPRFARARPIQDALHETKR